MSLFGNTGSLFGQSGQQTSGGGFFGAAGAAKPSLFGNTMPAATPSQPQTGGLFGASTANTGGGLFGSQQKPASTGLFGSTTNQAQGGGIFGSATTQQLPQQSPSPFPGSLFSKTAMNQPQTTGIFGQSFQQPQQQPQQQQQQQQPQPQLALSQSRSAIWSPGGGPGARTKSVPEQLRILANKWSSHHPDSEFRSYLYNAVPEDQAIFYQPNVDQDETKWEEALKNKPNPGTVPVPVHGFFELGLRLGFQEQRLGDMRKRMKEISESLTVMLQHHSVVIAVRAADAKKKNQALNRRCLSLATKVQVLRNRGYAMDDVEEELRKKLKSLEHVVMDPALSGRAEEIWARMVAIREMARRLQGEADRSTRDSGGDSVDGVTVEFKKAAQKVLNDYESQLKHLEKELEKVQKDFTSWEGEGK